MTTDATLLRPVIQANVSRLTRRQLARLRRQIVSVSAATSKRFLSAAEAIILTGAPS
jgi:hypothetical protein